MAVDADLVWQMAREVCGRGPIDPDLLAETADRLGGLLRRVRAADETALQRVPPAFRFDPADPAYGTVAPGQPPAWAGLAETSGGTGYGGAGGTTGVAAPPPAPMADAGAGSGGPEFLWWNATALAAAIRRRDLSPVEVTRAALERIAAAQPRLNAFVTITADLAMDQAQAAEAAAARGEWAGPLHGVPVALKDIIETAGVRTTGGSKLLADYVPEQDATCAVRLRAAGAVVVGKTATHEFAFGPTTDSPYLGPTRNPWQADHVPAGSSGGSGAAVAAGLVPLALGTDTGGSIRMPAAACGTFGIKPTYGRVSKAGVLSLSWSLRAGRVEAVVAAAEATEHQLIQWLMGTDAESSRRIMEAPPLAALDPGAGVLLQVRDLAAGGGTRIRIQGVGLDVRAGEIHGISGVAGSGQRELAEALLGVLPVERGEITLSGKAVTDWPVPRRLQAGVMLIPEDRIHDATLPALSLYENLVLCQHREIFPGLRYRPETAIGLANAAIAEYEIKAPSAHVPVAYLSGGNMQKVIVARGVQFAATHNPSLIIAANPTRGLDVRTVRQVHDRLRDIAAAGGSVLLISEDLDELMAECHTISVMYQGELTARFAGPDYDRYRIGEAMLGRREQEAGT